MKPLASDALCFEGSRQAEPLQGRRDAVVEGRVKNADLGHDWARRRRRPGGRQIMGLVQGGQDVEGFEGVKDIGIQLDRPREVPPTMDNPVTNRRQFGAAEMPVAESHHRGEKGFMGQVSIL